MKIKIIEMVIIKLIIFYLNVFKHNNTILRIVFALKATDIFSILKHKTQF